jgi:hypothetical protein
VIPTSCSALIVIVMAKNNSLLRNSVSYRVCCGPLSYHGKHIGNMANTLVLLENSVYLVGRLLLGRVKLRESRSARSQMEGYVTQGLLVAASLVLVGECLGDSAVQGKCSRPIPKWDGGGGY